MVLRGRQLPIPFSSVRRILFVFYFFGLTEAMFSSYRLFG